MSETHKDGGPAFPRQAGLPLSSGKVAAPAQDGMTMRDYFASDALNGMLASDSSVDRTKVNKDVWAKAAYSFADAMLKAREHV